MNKLEIARYSAVQYLLANGRRDSEWAAEGLLDAVSKAMRATRVEDLTSDKLDEMIEDAANN